MVVKDTHSFRSPINTFGTSTVGGGDTVKNKANKALVLVKMTFSKGTKK